MNRVREQSHRPADRDHQHLQQGGDPSATRLILTARMPWALPSNAESTESAPSWLCGANTDAITPRKPV